MSVGSKMFMRKRKTVALCALCAALLAAVTAACVFAGGGRIAQAVDLSGVKAYSLQELTGSPIRGLFDSEGNAKVGEFAKAITEEGSDAAFKTHMIVKQGGNPDVYNGRPFVSMGIFMQDTGRLYDSDDSTENGYLLAIDERYGIGIGTNVTNGTESSTTGFYVNLRGMVYWNAAAKETADAKSEATYPGHGVYEGGSFAPAGLRDKIYSTEGFDLEFGAKDFGDHVYVYVKIDDTVVLGYETTEAKPTGKQVAVTGFNRVTMIDCDVFESAAAEADPTSYGLATLNNTKHANGLRDISAKGDFVYEGNTHETGEVGTFASNKNAEFTTHVTMSMRGYNWLKVGIFMASEINDWNWYGGAADGRNGYLLSIDTKLGYNKDSSRQLMPGISIGKDANNSTVSDFIYNKLTWAENPDLYDEVYATGGFELTLGAQDYVVGGERKFTYVYVKINGKTVLAMYDTGAAATGAKVAVQNYNRAVLSDAAAVRTADSGVKKYGVQNLFGVAETALESVPVGTIAENADIAFKARFVMTDDPNEPYLRMGIRMNDTNHWYWDGDNAANGHMLVIDRNQGIGIANNVYDGMQSLLDWPVNVYDSVLWTDAPGLRDEIFAAAGFILEFGTADYKVGDTVAFTELYMSVNGRKLLSANFADLAAYADFGNTIKIESWGRAVLQDLSESAQTTVYDYYDLSQRAAAVNYSGKVGDFAADKNAAFKATVMMDLAEYDVYKVGIFMSNTGNWYNDPNPNGYMLTIDAKKGFKNPESAGRDVIPGMAIGFSGNNGSNSDDPFVRISWADHEALYNEIIAAGGFELEFGATDYSIDGDRQYTLVYVKVNGNVVLQTKHTGTQPTGTAVAVGGKGTSFHDAWGQDSKTNCDIATARTDIARPEPAQTTVYDYYDLTRRLSAADYSGKVGDFAGNKNAAFKAKVTMDLAEYDVYKVGIFMTDTGNWYTESSHYEDAPNGYMLTIDAKKGYRNPATEGRDVIPGMAIGFSGNNGSNSDDPFVRISWADHEALYNEIIAAGGFELEFGATDYSIDGDRQYTLVYVKVNGNVVLRIEHTGTQPTGTAVAVGGKGTAYHDMYGQDSKTNCDIATTRTDIVEEPGEPSDEVAVQDYYDITGKIVGETYSQAEFLGNFADDKTENVALKARLTILPEVADGPDPRVVGILQQSTEEGTWDVGGYWLVLRKSGLTLAGGQHWEQTFVTTDDTDVLAAVYAANGFVLEFGAQSYVNADDELVYTYVYVKINDELALEYEDRVTERPLGNAINSLLYGVRVETTQNLADLVEAEDTTVYDFYELTGSKLKPHYSGKLGDFTVNKNAAVKMRVNLKLDEYDVFKVGIFMTDTGNWYTESTHYEDAPNGYMLTIDAKKGFKDPESAGRTVIPGMAIGFSGNNGSNSDDPFARINWADHEDLYNEMAADDGFILEFGATDCLLNGDRLYTLVYVKVNGTIVLQAEHSGTQPAGTAVAVGGKGSSFHDAWGSTSRTSCDTSTALEPVRLTFAAEDEIRKVDWYEATGQVSIDFCTGNVNAYTPGGDLKARENVALTLKITVSPTLQEYVQLYFFLAKPVNNHVWDADLSDETTGYQIELGVDGLLSGTDNGDGGTYPKGYSQLARLSDWQGDGKVYDVFAPGGEYIVELGIRNAFINNEPAGNYVYVRVDGREILGYLDDDPNPFNGSNFITMRMPAPKGSVIFSTTKPTFTITQNSDALDLPETYLAVVEPGTETYELAIPVKTGYVLTAATYGGAALTLTETAGGYQATIPAEDGVLAVVAEERTFAVTLPADDGAVYVADGITAGRIGYRGRLTVTITPPTGKRLTEITVNGSPVEATLTDGKYVVTVERATADIAVAATYVAETYTVTAAETAGGSVTLSAASVSAGGSVVVTVTPAEGYVLQSLTVNGKAVSLRADGTYTIENVYENQTVTAVFMEKTATEQPAADKKGCGCGGLLAGGAIGGVAVAALLLAAAFLLLRRPTRKAK